MKLLIPLIGLMTLWPAQAQERVLSLDYCADQYVMALADTEDILAVSPAAGSEYSYLADRSSGLEQVRPTLEEVLWAQPDIVVRQWGGGFNAGAYLNSFGISVVQVSNGADVESTRANLRSIGAALGQVERAEQLVQEMDRRLDQIQAQLPPESRRPRALYITPGGLSSGSGTFVHEMLTSAGVINMGAEGGHKGWQEINVEAIALNPPDLIVGAFFDLSSNHVNYWSMARHSFLKQVLQKTPTVFIPGAQVACTAWFFADAVETIHRAAEGLGRRKAGIDAE